MKKTVLIISLTMLLLLSVFGVFSWVGGRLHPVERDMIIGGKGFFSGIKNLSMYLASVSDLLAERNTLRLENDRLRAEIAEQQLLTRENDELRKLVGFSEKERIPITSTRLYGYQAVDPHKAYLDAGSNQGVKKGDWVVGGEGNLVGRITDVRDLFSIVTTISSREISLQVVGSNTAEIIGVTQGGNAVEIILGYIPKHIRLQVGMNVYSAVENSLTREYLLGSVDSVTSRPSDLFQQAVVTLFAPLSRITYVGILRADESL